MAMISTAPTLRLLHLTFDLPIYPRQLSQWRGAFIAMGGWENDLFHNHNGDEALFHRYPLVQYRVMDGKAGIFAIGEAVDALQAILTDNEWEIQWQGKPRGLRIEHLQMDTHHLRMLEQPKTYQGFDWLALNQKSYEKWRQCKNLAERAVLLENILANQIQCFLEVMGWPPPEPLEVNLQQINHMQQVKSFGNAMIAFNITYEANVFLPPFIGLGRSASLGFGWQAPLRDADSSQEPRKRLRVRRANQG